MPRFRSAAALVSLVSLAACANATAPLDAATAARNGSPDGMGAVYVLTNATSGNAVVAYRRAVDGTLTLLGRYATGGLGVGGTIDPLVSQYAVVLSEDHATLFAVDAGSDDVASFHLDDDAAPSLVSRVPSGGARPTSLAVHGGLLYVLNAGARTVSGFRVTGAGGLVPLPGTLHALAAGADGPAAIRFTPDGRYLVLTERASNRLALFPVLSDGRLGDPTVTPAAGGASFGFDVTARGQIIVSETQGAASSYAIGAGGALATRTASAPTAGSPACWVTVTADGRFAYVTNAGSGTVAGFAVDAAGQLTPLTPGTATGDAGTGAAPLDLDHVGSRLLYTLEAGTGTIGTFVVGADGRLTARPDTPVGAPASGLQGLAAF